MVVEQALQPMKIEECLDVSLKDAQPHEIIIGALSRDDVLSAHSYVGDGQVVALMISKHDQQSAEETDKQVDVEDNEEHVLDEDEDDEERPKKLLKRVQSEEDDFALDPTVTALIVFTTHIKVTKQTQLYNTWRCSKSSSTQNEGYNNVNSIT